MHHCEVMLKDLADAKRINTAVAGVAPPPGAEPMPPTAPGAAVSEPRCPARALPALLRCCPAPCPAPAPQAAPRRPPHPQPPTRNPCRPAQVGLLSASLISHLFWPEAPEAELQLPAPIEAAMAEFGRRYHQLKSPRKLGWHPSLGVVELELEVAGVALEFKVSGRWGGALGGVLGAGGGGLEALGALAAGAAGWCRRWDWRGGRTTAGASAGSEARGWPLHCLHPARALPLVPPRPKPQALPRPWRRSRRCTPPCCCTSRSASASRLPSWRRRWACRRPPCASARSSGSTTACSARRARQQVRAAPRSRAALAPGARAPSLGALPRPPSAPAASLAAAAAAAAAAITTAAATPPAAGQVVYRRAAVLDPARATMTDASELPPDDDPQAAAASEEERLLAEMAPYENYIVGMLTNFESLTLERLHSMLRMFVINPKYDKSQEQLADFLAHLVGRERIAMEGALYRKRAAG
jgi:hypothetical protein